MGFLLYSMQELPTHKAAVSEAECQQLEERQAQAVDVAPGIRMPVELLGGHVAERAQNIADVGQPLLVLLLGEAEVGDPDASLAVQE